MHCTCPVTFVHKRWDKSNTPEPPKLSERLGKHEAANDRGGLPDVDGIDDDGGSPFDNALEVPETKT